MPKRLERGKWYVVSETESVFVHEEYGYLVGRVKKVGQYYTAEIGSASPAARSIAVLFMFEDKAKQSVEDATAREKYQPMVIPVTGG